MTGWYGLRPRKRSEIKRNKDEGKRNEETKKSEMRLADYF